MRPGLPVRRSSAPRAGGLDLFRIYALFDAVEHHLLQIHGFRNQPPDSYYWSFAKIIVASLGFTMTGLLQIGTFFGIRRPFRARGIIKFVLTLRWYGHVGMFLWSRFEVPYTYTRAFDYPIRYSISWFFTAHTLMSLATVFLHGGMASTPRGTYAMVDVAILWLLIFRQGGGPWGFGSGFNWTNAVFMYVFAGFFAVHGWPLGRLATIGLFLVLLRVNYWLVSRDIFNVVRPKWHWIAVNFRLVIHRGRWWNYEYAANGYRGYICPLSYVWGVTALYMFNAFNLPAGIAAGVSCIARRVFMLHLIECHPLFHGRVSSALRAAEMSATPALCLANSIRYLVSFALLGCVFEFPRELLFDTIESGLQFIGGKVTSPCPGIRP